MNKSPKNSIEIFDDCIIVKGAIDVKVFNIIAKLSKVCGFTHMTALTEERGMKFIKVKK